MVLSAVDLEGVAACWRQMVGSAEVILAVAVQHRIQGAGLIRAIRPGGDGPVVVSLASCSGSCRGLARSERLVFHIAWRMTANLRATATRAFLNPHVFANLRPHAFRVENRKLRVSRIVAAS
jgi:hypothetical protein